ncbi:hypothetical protein ABL716_000844 [Escherichia coli]|uniref:Uncharacterized protein n=1 Tax=Escherichia phage vB_EcoM_112 TaxID=1495285 RepID=A0A023ZUQ4_9CAUD|nr:hypothetical protein e112_101 [Escherichia phage vB_EcoM_112]AHY83299.1 hypothetical protein e112_101 [Escherichia phage vB_EcoM_112]QXN68192.1 hypothetical protein JK1_0097 [Escherichia phage JK1]CAJ1092997.1 Phage protein [Escherichia phage vB_Eco_QOTSP]
MKAVIETTDLFGDLVIEKRDNVYVLTQEDDSITILPMELAAILSYAPSGVTGVTNITGDLQVRFYRGLYGGNIETEFMCLSINNWATFVAKVKEFLESETVETPEKAKLQWAKDRGASIINPVAANYTTTLDVKTSYEDGDVVLVRQIDDSRAHIVTFTKDEAIALKTYLDSVIPTMISK